MKKIGVICLILVMALGAMGASYALWSDVLYLDATVETGDIGLHWTQGTPEVIGDDKDVSTATCAIVDNTLTITITNAYPCVTYRFPIDLHGDGSVPVDTRFVRTSGTLPDNFVIMPIPPMQIHQGDDWYGVVEIHLDNTATQGITYDASWQLDYWQYNEAGP